MESAGFAGGRFVARETSPGVCAMVPMIHVADHLGSVRAVVDGISGEVVETNDYYPFGGRWDVAAGLKDDTNRFRYNSKEEQSSLYPASFRDAVSYIDYGARQYDPVLGRWFAQDPLAEKYYGISPYAFCNNKPVNYVDPDGRKLRVAYEYQNQFKDDIEAVFGDKVESFSFEDEELRLNVSKRDFMKGLSWDQKCLFRGLYKALTDKRETKVAYENNYSIEDDGDVKNVDVIKEWGGALYDKESQIIVVAPDIGTVEVCPDDFSSPVEVVQNTASGLFHEIGERHESNEKIRGSVIIYENYARRILGLPERPYDLNHINPQTPYQIY